VTAIVPDPEGVAWKDLDLYKKCHASRIGDEYDKPFPEFLHHHFVTRSVPQDKKVKTMVGNKIWWSRVGNESFIYPGAIKIMSREEASNGEIWVVERPLWSEFNR